MFGFTKKEAKEQLVLEKRRIAEEERKQRIFDAKARTIGVDKNAIEEQLKEKKHIENVEREREQFFDEQ